MPEKFFVFKVLKFIFLKLLLLQSLFKNETPKQTMVLFSIGGKPVFEPKRASTSSATDPARQSKVRIIYLMKAYFSFGLLRISVSASFSFVPEM